MFRLARRRIGLSLLAVSLPMVSVTAQSAESLFEEGVTAYRRGDSQAAADAFKAALAANPSHEDAYRLWERAEQRVLLEMLVESGELGALAERFLRLAKVGRREVLSDPGGARDVVARLFDGSERERNEALLALQSRYGEWAVPALVGPLGDGSDVDRRVRAIQALIRLGEAAVVPLIQVLHSDDELTRTNAATVLGTLRDPRAAAALAWMAQDDASNSARAVASEALAKLGDALDSLGMSSRDPMALSLGLAKGWLSGDADLNKPYGAGQVAWHWEDGSLRGTPILAGLYGLHLAENTLRTAVDAGGGAAARSALAAVHAAQKAEIEMAGDLEGLADGGLLDGAREGLATLDLNLALAGHHRGDALRMLMDNGQGAAAAMLVRSMGPSAAEVGALRAALGGDDPAVAHAAAAALGRMGDASGDVVSRLGQSLTAVPDRIVVSIGDTGLRSGGDGWHLISSSVVAEGLVRARGFPPKDVVVVQDGLQGVTLDTMIWGLRNDPRSSDVPIIVVTADVNGVESLYGDAVSKVVGSATLRDVAEVAGDPDAAMQAAMERARRAARVLAGLPADAVRGVAGSVSAALTSGGDDSVKAAVLRLAGRHGVLDALSSVEELVTSARGDLRVAALGAAAQLWAVNGGAPRPTDELRASLEAALNSGEPELAQAAAEALGQFGGEAVPVLVSAD